MLVRLSLLGLLVAVPAQAQLPTPKEPERLFRSREPLDLTLLAPLKALFKNRDTLDKKPVEGILVVREGTSADSIPVKLETRGHYRLKSSTCRFAPLKVYFDKPAAKETPFRGQGSLKLITHCNDNEKYEQNVLVEEGIYRVYNLLTPLSHRTRLAHIRYVIIDDEDHGTPKEITRYGFFLEDDDAMGKRVGGKENMVPSLALSDLDVDQVDLMSVFEYMVGNTDWSVYALHNVRVVQFEGLSFFYPVAYDFDFSGLVNAPYAVPDYRLPIKNVRQRLYRGPCRKLEELTPMLQRFIGRKDSIEAIFRDQPGIDPKRVEDVVEYLDDFFEQAASPKDFDRALDYACRNR